ncbi:hypothetical protein Q5752_004185 [Cryptotrichosporon argae]
MMLSIAGLIHRGIVFGSLGFGVYGTVVITQNLMVKRRRLLDAQAAEKAAAQAAEMPS